MKGKYIMIEKEILENVADKLSKDIMAYAVYIVKNEENISFVVASKNKLESKKLYELSKNISMMLQKNIMVIDINNFSVTDKIRIMSGAAIVHTENEFEKNFMEMETQLAFQMQDKKRNSIIERKKVCGTFYVS